MKNEYEIIGKYLSLCNGIEFHLNMGLEMIFEYVNKNSDPQVKIELIDFLHESSINKRFELLKFCMKAFSVHNNFLKGELVKLESIRVRFTKKHQEYRDFIAHNPLIKNEDKFRIVSSRRIKGGLNSIDLENLTNEFKELSNILDEISMLIGEVQKKIKVEVPRELT